MSELGQARRKPSRGIPEPNQRAYESGDGTAGDVLHRRSRRGTGMSIRYNRSCEQRESTLVPLDGIERGHHRHSTEDGRIRQPTRDRRHLSRQRRCATMEQVTGLSSFLAVGSEGIADICAQLAASNGGSRERWKEGGY